MSWSNDLAAYLGGAPIKYACLFTLDGSNCFGEAGDSKEKISAGEISKAVKTVATDEKIQGLTIAGNKYVYILDDSDVFVYKKLSKACLFFHKKTYACCIIAESEPRVLLKHAIALRDQLDAAGLQ